MKRKFLLALLLCLPLYLQSQPALSESGTNAVNANDQGLVLTGQAKIDYMTKKMDANFHPKENVIPKPFQTPKGWKHEKIRIDYANLGHFSRINKKGNRTILQLHGGGYVKAMSDNHRNLGLKYANLTNASDVFYVDYRTAPEHVYPTALEDALLGYKELLRRGIKSSDIILTGDSAGGNLAIELTIYLKDHKMPLPGAVILVSPWADMENTAASRKFNYEKDLILGKGTPLEKVLVEASYAGNLDKSDPRLSPINADLKGLPPLLIQTGGHEVLLTENQQLAAKAAADGVPVTITVYPEMSHDFALAFPEMKESKDSFKEIADFVNRYMPRK